MKKKLLFGLLLVLTLTLTGCASTAWMNGFEVSKTIEVPDLSKDELYIRSNFWAVETFYDSDSVIEFSDKEAGVIKGKYIEVIDNGYLSLFTDTSEISKVRVVIGIMCNEGSVQIVLNHPSVTSGTIIESKLRETCNSLIACLEERLYDESIM